MSSLDDIARVSSPIFAATASVLALIALMIVVEICLQRANRQLIFMFLATVCFMANLALMSFQLADVWDVTSESSRLFCRVSSKTVLSVYVLGNTFLYLYLYGRMRISRPGTKPSLEEKALLAGSIVVAVTFPPTLSTFVEGVIVANRACVNLVPSAFPIVGLVMDSTLSAGFIYVFYQTLRRHLLSISGSATLSSAQVQMTRTMRANLLWSSVAIATSFVSLTFNVAAPSMFEDPALFSFTLSTVFALTLIDQVANVVAILACTNLWRKHWPGHFATLLQSNGLVRSRLSTGPSTKTGTQQTQGVCLGKMPV